MMTLRNNELVLNFPYCLAFRSDTRSLSPNSAYHEAEFMNYQELQPGHYPDMRNDAYHAASGISNSHLGYAELAPIHY